MYYEYLEDFPVVIKNDFIRLYCGKELGYGVYRQVFKHEFDDTCVIKVERGGNKIFSNVREWAVWNEIKDTPFAKYFAPCVAISENGNVLIQRRTQIPQKKKYPQKMPAFFTDFKYQNFGLYKGKLVCHDYAGFNIDKGLTKRMINANWWNWDV